MIDERKALEALERAREEEWADIVPLTENEKRLLLVFRRFLNDSRIKGGGDA